MCGSSTLARFLSRRGGEVKVYAFERLGVSPVKEGYAHLVQSLDLVAIVPVVGGTDILLRGDEAGLGTPDEDMTSLAAAAGLDVPTRMVTCVGFGIDTFHGVCHANWLENVAALTAEGAFLGAAALLERMSEVRLNLDAVRRGPCDPESPEHRQRQHRFGHRKPFRRLSPRPTRGGSKLFRGCPGPC